MWGQLSHYNSSVCFHGVNLREKEKKSLFFLEELDIEVNLNRTCSRKLLVHHECYYYYCQGRLVAK